MPARVQDAIDLREGGFEARHVADAEGDRAGVEAFRREGQRLGIAFDEGDAFVEAYRVLKPGGHYLCLEFSSVDVPWFDTLYDLYSFNVIPALGQVVAGDGEAYRYLVESIRKFPRPPAFAGMLRTAGFRRVDVQILSGGIVALHSGWRL